MRTAISLIVAFTLVFSAVPMTGESPRLRTESISLPTTDALSAQGFLTGGSVLNPKSITMKVTRHHIAKAALWIAAGTAAASWDVLHRGKWEAVSILASMAWFSNPLKRLFKKQPQSPPEDHFTKTYPNSGICKLASASAATSRNRPSSKP